MLRGIQRRDQAIEQFIKASVAMRRRGSHKVEQAQQRVRQAEALRQRQADKVVA